MRRRGTATGFTCDTRGVKLHPIIGALIGLSVLFSGGITAGCTSGAETVAEIPETVPAAENTAVEEDIPVEALPDPLPAPYLFRDDVVFEEAPITETIYVVQPGDTLATIATQFCLTVEEIQRLNNIVDVDTLSVGQELRIPIREGGCGVASPATADSEEPEGPQRPPGEIYIVQEGDTLAQIAAAFGYTWVDLMNYNGLTEAQAANIQIGQALIIPPPPAAQEEAAQEQGPTEPPG
ncbi:MAG: LysM peptidoglycan-binding domain-containing protein [Chloroflexi bacterium]|nr:LysM peptidoglycan-binding domain-containing protein [Chloroflexota bacterium]MYG90258.1 LysM peptidoglycan-binding domain-containing protein [Chloroflexota bacterium]MYJ91597.1 LysM peptidoglycan-binding domain-containing protein [Chloroflexota bacterium]